MIEDALETVRSVSEAKEIDVQTQLDFSLASSMLDTHVVPATNLQNLQNIQVLVVEDDPDSRDLITTTLRQLGAKVTAVPSAIEAINVLSHLKPDILISDIRMPGIDGYMLMQQIREVTDTGQIPAIALTSYTTEADQQKALAADFQKHLAKPMEPIQLVEAVLKLLHSCSDSDDFLSSA